MKTIIKICTIFLLVLLIYTQRYSLYLLLFEDNLNDINILALDVEGDIFINGFHFYSIQEPIWLIGRGAERWSHCEYAKPKFSKLVLNLSNQTISLRNNFEWIAQKSEFRTIVLVRMKSQMIYIVAYEDHAGTLTFGKNSKNEICE